jgi:hypothetical protein
MTRRAIFLSRLRAALAERKVIFRVYGLALIQCAMLLLDNFCTFILSCWLFLWALATGQSGEPASPHESMSARAGRGMLNFKRLARVLGGVVDRVFALWQPPYAELPDGRRFEHPSHCIRAFIKTRHLAYLPREYHGPLPPSIEACYGNTTTPTP